MEYVSCEVDRLLSDRYPPLPLQMPFRFWTRKKIQYIVVHIVFSVCKTECLVWKLEICLSVCLSDRSYKETPILAKSGPNPLPALTCIPRESVADTHTSSLVQLSHSVEPCALSYATHSFTGGTIACARVGTSSEIFRK